jgi:catechol-2,3-dioxygenase
LRNNLRLGHINIFVKDPLKSRIFYEDVLGFEFKIVQKNKYVWMRKENIEILLRPKANEFDI